MPTQLGGGPAGQYGAPGGAPAASPQPGGLDVMTKNAGENVRRFHARELAANVVVALFRVVKLSLLHSLDNQAMVRQVDETVHLIAEYGQRTDHNVSILFAHGSVFVGGQLLRANRGVYEGALELGEILGKVGAAEIGIRREVQPNDFFAFASVLADALRKPKPPKIDRPSPNIRLRGLAASAALRENILSERVEPNVQVARTYASAVVIMRRFFEDLRRGRYDLPQRVKRVAQRLVDLSMGETPAFLGVTAARNQNYDEAGRAVNTAILSLAMTRQIANDTVQLARVAMAALLYDCARARIAGVVGVGGPAILPSFSEQQEMEAPAGTAVVLTALGRINEPSVMRTVIDYEAHWERRRARLGPPYRGLRAPSLQARIIHVARTFNDMLTPAPGQEPPSADEAIAKMEQEMTDAADRTVLRLLIGALGIFTTGTLVKLNTGETGIVSQTPSHPSLYSQPKVRLVLDANGGWLQPPVEIDLAHQRKRGGEASRHIKEVVATADDPAGAQLRAYAAGPVQQLSGVRQQAGFTQTPPPNSPSFSNPPSSQFETPSYQQNPPSYQQNPPSYQQNPPSYQQNPPSYQQNPPSYQQSSPSHQVGPPSYQVTPPSFQQPAQQNPYAQQQNPYAQQQPQQNPYAQQQNPYAQQQPQQNPYAQQQPQYTPQPPAPFAMGPRAAPNPAPAEPAQQQYAQALQQPQPKGRASTLQSPLYEPQQPQHPQQQPRQQQAYYDDRFEAPQQGYEDAGHSGMDVGELVEDDYQAETAGGAATRAVSWQEQQHLVASQGAIEEEETNALPEPEPEPEPEPLADDQPRNPPTAEGTLQKTPFVHLLIYMLDQRLSGTTVFTLPDGVQHWVYFHDGTPAKVRTGTMLEPLDRVLVDLGMVDEGALRGTLMEVVKKKVLHGRVLVMKGLLDREKVIHALRVQALRKVTHLFELPGETRYAYYKDENLLYGYGGPELTPTEPLATIMAGIRLMAGDPLVDATLAKILGRPLALHLDAEIKRFQMTREEQSVVDLIRTKRMTLKEVVHANVAQERVVRLTVYALVVTRHLDLGVAAKPPVGQGRPPVGNEAIRQPEPLPAPPRAKPAAAPKPAVAAVATAPRAAPNPAPAEPAPARRSTTSMPPQAGAPAQPAAPRGRSGTLGGDAAFSAPAAPAAPAAPLSPRAQPRAPVDVSFAPEPEAAQPMARPTTKMPRVAQPAQQQPPQYTPQPPQYAAPQQPQQPQYGAPQQPQYAPQPPQQQYAAPQQNYGAPQQPQYGAPQQQYGAPQQPQYGAPQQNYGAPQQPQYGAPAQPQYGAPQPAAPFAMTPNPPAFTMGPQAAPNPAVPAAPPARTTSQPMPPAGRTTSQPMPPPAASERPEITARRAEIEKRAATVDSEDYYQMLGVAPEATPEQVKTAYFGLAKNWHPDRLPSELLDVKPQVARVFARFSEAYQTLMDPAKAKEYQQLTKSGGGSPDDQEKVQRVVDAALEFQKAEILLKKNDLAGAEQLANRAVSADPDQPEYLTLLVWVRALRRGDPPELREGQTSTHYDDLIKILDGVLAKEKEFERALFYRGVLQKRAGRVDKAIRDFRMVTQLNPKNLDAVREVRLFEMRKRGGPGGSGNKGGQGGDDGGLFGKFFKR